MATNRRVFLEVVGMGAAGATISACVGFVEDGGIARRDGLGGQTSGQTGSGGATGAGGSQGAGGAGVSGEGGAVDPGMGGQGGTIADASVPPPPRDAAADQAREVGGGAQDSGPARDAGTILQPGDIAAGNVSGLAVGGLNAIPNRTIALGRDANGVYALTLVCTHQGCTAAPATASGVRQINCPCHGSQFDRNGAVIRGPATRPLVHFAVTIDAGGNIIVHGNTQVAATVRAVV